VEPDHQSPPLPPSGVAQGASEASGGPWWAWLIIVVSTALMAWSAQTAPSVAAAEANDAVAANDGATFAVLKFQAKNIIGLEALTSAEDLDEVVDQIKAQVRKTTPRQIGAAAALEVFSGADDESRQSALRYVDKAIDSTDPPSSLLLAIQRAIAEPSTLAESDWSELKEELGWFGELLAASEGGPDTERSDEFRDAGKALSKLLIIGIGVAVVAGLVGSVLLFVAIYRASNGNLITHLKPPSGKVGRVLMGAFAIYIGSMAGGNFLFTWLAEKGIDQKLSPAVAQGLSLAYLAVPVFLALAWVYICRKSAASAPGGMRQAMGVNPGRGLFKEVLSGIIGYIAMIPIIALGIATTLVSVLLIELFNRSPDGEIAEPISHPIVEWMGDGDPVMMLLAFLLAAVLAPLFEETMFRGAFHGALRRRWRFFLAALVSGIVFAAVHPQGLLAIPALTAMGFGFAMIREWRGSLIAPMTAHAVHNGTLVGVMWMVFSN